MKLEIALGWIYILISNPRWCNESRDRGSVQGNYCVVAYEAQGEHDLHRF